MKPERESIVADAPDLHDSISLLLFFDLIFFFFSQPHLFTPSLFLSRSPHPPPGRRRHARTVWHQETGSPARSGRAGRRGQDHLQGSFVFLFVSFVSRATHFFLGQLCPRLRRMLILNAHSLSLSLKKKKKKINRNSARPRSTSPRSRTPRSSPRKSSAPWPRGRPSSRKTSARRRWRSRRTGPRWRGRTPRSRPRSSGSASRPPTRPSRSWRRSWAR